MITLVTSKILSWNFIINIEAIMIALLFSVAIGEFYPAKKAAASNPVEALRYE
ncbi:MAG: hypothetical protein MJB14_22045 [Spirochaetes bacterium]|nr:hypothetical protein [Spirochaetota bacterium]